MFKKIYEKNKQKINKKPHLKNFKKKTFVFQELYPILPVLRKSAWLIETVFNMIYTA